MSTSAPDPVIHNPQRLRIVATLAALPDGDTLSVSRLQTMIGLPTGSPIIGLCELGHAGYVRTAITGDDGHTELRRPHQAGPGRARSLHRRASAAAAPGSHATSTGHARWRRRPGRRSRGPG